MPYLVRSCVYVYQLCEQFYPVIMTFLFLTALHAEYGMMFITNNKFSISVCKILKIKSLVKKGKKHNGCSARNFKKEFDRNLKPPHRQIIKNYTKKCYNI